MTHSLSGGSARQVSACRPPQRIYALTPDPTAIRHLNFAWGITPVLVHDPYGLPSHLSRVEHFIHTSNDFAPNDCAVITCGQVTGSSDTPRGTNMVKIYWK